jgi:membrane-bound lytic murein transglycosylase MltF
MTVKKPTARNATLTLSVALAVFASARCGSGKAPEAETQLPATERSAASEDAELAEAPPGTFSAEIVNRRWTGDFDGMVKRRMIRVLTPYSKTQYFIDRGVQRGIVYDVGVKLEEVLNQKLKTTHATKIHVVFVPTTRDGLQDALIQGRGDIVVAGITVTPEREKIADFTIPTKRDVRQIVVTGPGAPEIRAVEDLAGQQVAVRESSIQYESLARLNETFKQQGKPPVAIRTVPPSLEDEDLLEMANAGLLKIVVVDDIYARFWQQILPDITPHPAVAVREEGDLAWAVRKGSAGLIAELNAFIKNHAVGTTFGNVLLAKYLTNTKFVSAATSEAELRKFRNLVALFRKYAAQYEVDYLLMMAQGYQESRLDHTVKSPVGAIGVMQVMPATGKELKVGDVSKLDSNINAGVKYIRFMMDTYFKDEPMDDLNKGLFAFASYNAGPNRIRQLRQLAATRGLNPNVWFNNVERVVGEKIGRETVTYVANIFKYYVAYTLTLDTLGEKAKGARAVTGR